MLHVPVVKSVLWFGRAAMDQVCQERALCHVSGSGVDVAAVAAAACWATRLRLRTGQGG